MCSGGCAKLLWAGVWQTTAGGTSRQRCQDGNQMQLCALLISQLLQLSANEMWEGVCKPQQQHLASQ